jgi:hypothetical protein
MMHPRTRISGSATFSSTSEDTEDVNMTGSDQVVSVLLLLQATLLVDGVVVDEVITERFPVLVIERIAVSRVLASS